MKKLLFLIAFTVFGLTNFYAQDFNFGAKTGLNFASIGGDESEDWDGKTGFHVGLVAELMLADRLALQPEIIYSSQGAKGEGSDSFEGEEESYEVDLKLNYINFPLLAKYYIKEGLSLEAGPQVGFLLSADYDYTETYSFEGETETFSGSEDIKDEMNSIDLAVAAGLGYKLDMGLFFNARYNLGVSNIYSSEDSNDDYSQNNNVIQFSVGYLF